MMKTLTGLLLAATLVVAGAAAASESVDVVVVTAKRPASKMVDITERISAEIGAALRSEPLAIVVPEIRIEPPRRQEHG
jgi:hypothetical protein